MAYNNYPSKGYTQPRESKKDSEEWKKFLIPESEIKENVTSRSVEIAKAFGEYLGTDELKADYYSKAKAKLTTSQLRKFFGEVKRQQMVGFRETDFILLKPKLAYAVGRDDKNTKIDDFYKVISDAIDKVNTKKDFNNFVKIFEAIVAYHKIAEKGKN